MDDAATPLTPWMTLEEAASYLRTTPDALRKQAARRRVPSHRLGKRLMFHREEVDRAIRRG